MICRKSRIRIYVGAMLAIAGSFLIAVCIIGESGFLLNYERNPGRSWERFDPQLGERSKDLASFYKEAGRRSGKSFEKLPASELMQILFNTVCDRFTHKQARYSLFSNWFLWVLGKISRPLGAIHEPHALLKYGNSGICDQQSYILLTLAINSGIKARHVGLGGHIIMEAWYDNDWHMYDPDEEVFAFDPKNLSGGVRSVEFLTENPDLIRKLYGRHREGEKLERIVAFFTTRENNTFVSIPEGSWFNCKSQALKVFETISDYLKWIVPSILILFGAWFLFARKMD